MHFSYVSQNYLCMNPLKILKICLTGLIAGSLLFSYFYFTNTNYTNNSKAEINLTNEIAMAEIPAAPSFLTTMAKDSVRPLSAFWSPNLQHNLNKTIGANATWTKLISSKKMVLGVVDLTDKLNPRFASINGDEMMYAASLPKIAVLLAAEDALDKGEIEHTNQLEKDMRLMISKSNNKATTRIIDLLGFEKIEDVVTNKEYNFYNKENGGGLWVGKRYAAGGATNREPIKNLSHAATANQVCRFYYQLINHNLISETRSEHMLSMLEAPEINHKFVNSLTKIDPDAKLFRKSGTWKTWHADSVLVWGESRKYILVALINDGRGEQIIRDLVEPLDQVILMN